jgi:foldase protein PrsA
MSDRGRTRRNSAKAAPAAFVVAWTVVLITLSMLSAGCADYVFTVNEKGIPRREFTNELNRRLAVVRATNPKELAGSRGVKLKADTARQLATEMIRRALMEDQAAKLGLTLAVDAVKKKVEDEKRKVGADKFEKDLKKQGLTEADYEELVRAELLVDAIGGKVGSTVKVSRDDALSFYLTHKELFGRSLMIHAAHIVTDTQGEAELALDEAKKGDFAKVAQQISKDVKTRAAGGDMGWLEKGSMDPDFEKAAFGLKSGQVSGVVKTAEGYQVIKVLERREASIPTFEECWQEAVKLAESRRKEDTFSDWLRTVYANARVDAGGVGVWDPRLGMVVEK